MLRVLLVACVMGMGMLGQPTRPQGDCGFSKLRARHVSDFVDRAVIARVTPEYPEEAKSKRPSGNVRVAVLIDKQGRVEKTCPVFVRGELKPQPGLIAAAETAALQWRFKPDFGLDNSQDVSFDYIEGVIIFKFVPPPLENDQNKSR
jgi:TonB family protein